MESDNTTPDDGDADRPLWRSRASSGVVFALIPLAGALGEWWFDCLDHTAAAFYATAGQVGPVFGLALFVEIVVVMTPVIAKQGATPANTATMRFLIRTNAGLLALSEGAALYAVGARASSTFLVVSVVLPWLLQVVLLADTAYTRVGLNRIRGG
jgi:hypothetical protein